MKSIFVVIKNVILWSHERGTWQYDVLCLLIIGTVFLVPSKYFGDRDRAIRALPDLLGEFLGHAVDQMGSRNMVREHQIDRRRLSPAPPRKNRCASGRGTYLQQIASGNCHSSLPPLRVSAT